MADPMSLPDRTDDRGDRVTATDRDRAGFARLEAAMAMLAQNTDAVERIAEAKATETENLLAALDAQARTDLADELAQIARDLDAISAGNVALPEIGDLLTLDELPMGSYVKVAGDEFLYVGHAQRVMALVDDRGISHEYPSSVGETFEYRGDCLA